MISPFGANVAVKEGNQWISYKNSELAGGSEKLYNYARRVVNVLNRKYAII